MSSMMNNTKWRECMTLLASRPVYLQLQLVGEEDFPLDYEASNQVLSEIMATDCLFVQRCIRYKSINAIRIAKTVFPAGFADDNVFLLAELKIRLQQLGQLPLIEDDQFIVIHGYHDLMVC
ncbi:MAG: hypothetical protein KA770_12815 [Shewanella sp.]|uniref:Uncharacterized protein n=2 Tax=Shewanella oncorhynchi TaxID=2726434 RepID=A0ABX1KK82_9GAMM|nr:hypothetical protein [Shewanella sp.]NLQ21919.1 hypothetical protein [Shewanella oncorhynchi]